MKILEGSLSETGRISAPVLLLVAENDVVQQDHVTAMRGVNRAPLAAGKEVEFLILPPYQNDGHMMFFEVGDYWSQVRRFLVEQLKE
ncbi:MAG: hypothetical protein ACC700_20275 [Anaerolineales bacterium]